MPLLTDCFLLVGLESRTQQTRVDTPSIADASLAQSVRSKKHKIENAVPLQNGDLSQVALMELVLRDDFYPRLKAFAASEYVATA